MQQCSVVSKELQIHSVIYPMHAFLTMYGLTLFYMRPLHDHDHGSTQIKWKYIFITILINLL